MQLLGPLVTTRQAGGYLDLKQDLHDARVDSRPEEASLLQDRSWSLLQRQSTSQGNMGDSESPDILCESCACIIHTNLQSCMSIFSETLHDHHI